MEFQNPRHLYEPCLELYTICLPTSALLWFIAGKFQFLLSVFIYPILLAGYFIEGAQGIPCTIMNVNVALKLCSYSMLGTFPNMSIGSYIFLKATGVAWTNVSC